MLRHERRLLVDCLVIGVALTAFVIAGDAYGVLHRLEDFLYDLRARTCQFFTAKPTDTLVHLDIDDPALDTIGWPLPRATVGRILDEVRLAGPKAVELDVLFDQPQDVQLKERVVATTAPSSRPATSATSQSATSQPAAASQPAIVEYIRTDHDAELATALKQLGNAIVPATFQPVPRYSRLVAAMIEELRKDPELESDQLAQVLQRRGDVKVRDEGLGELFFVARREAFDGRLRELDLGPETPFDQVRLRLLPRTPIEINTGAANVLREQWTKYLAARAFRRFAWPRPAGMTRYGEVRVALAPVRQLSAAASGGAFVDYTQFGSPVIRALPLLLEADDNVYPQMGLALACRMLDADVTKLRVEGDGRVLVIPRNNPAEAELRIPLAPPRVSTAGARYGHLMAIPWFGGRQWEHMYDWPAQQTSRQHLPMMEVWRAVLARQKIIRNNGEMDDAIRGVYEVMDSDRRRVDAYNAAIPPPDDHAARERVARELLEVEFAGYLDDFAKMKPAEKDFRNQTMEESLKALKHTLDLNPKLLTELGECRAALAKQLGGKAVLVGWTATAAIADFVPTSLHEKCPGAVVHGVVYNGIMTGELWRTAPWWITALTTFLLGALISFTTARFQPLTAMLIALAVACLFAIVNGFLLFDKSNLIVGAAAPLVAIGGVWAACTLTRVIIESAERSRITRRFSNYVDPKLVNHVLEDPQARFDGERREMTVVFTDLVGFTTLSEKLGEKIVPLLNELLGELVPVIRDHHQGYVNKFLGDGIMFFFNAPLRMENHARAAVATVIDMHAKLAEFNVRLRERGLPEIAMRAGVMTGEMIVGDAGGADQSDYTVLGDMVNTGARLEPANKAVGTNTLISARTADMLNGEFLIRPIGKLKVVGKDEAVMVYEPLAVSNRATDEQRELARCTAELVESYVQRRFATTLEIADAHENRFGKSKIVTIYRALAQQHLDTPPGEDFDGRIVLTEK